VLSGTARAIGRSRIHVGIDAAALTSQHTGVDRYLKELVLHLARIDAAT
jgi:hypothetical protein